MVIVRDPIIRDQTKNLSSMVKRNKDYLAPKIGSKQEVRERNEIDPKITKPTSITEIKPITEPIRNSDTSMDESKTVIETKTVPNMKSLETKPQSKTVIETKSAIESKTIAQRISYISDTKRPIINDPKLTNNNKEMNNYVTKTVKHLCRNPITGEGLPDPNFGQRKSIRKDGNPLLGTGYNSKSMRTW